jgi:molybdopterin-guanine dinucleotide biosynthesis protein A
MNYTPKSDMIREVKAAAFILAGGLSRRMERDKALLAFRGSTLLEHVAAQAAEVAEPITIVGPPERYSHLGYPVIADRHPGAGPLAGIEAALLSSPSERALILACDMPDIPVDLLRSLFEKSGDCVIPRTGDGRLNPLCAVWSRAMLPAVQGALSEGRLKVLDCLEGADVKEVAWPVLENANTPDEWVKFAG